VSASKLCSYAGLIPTTYSSGGKTFQGKITKQGNRWLRWALIEAAQRAIVKDAWLRGIIITESKGQGERSEPELRLQESSYRLYTNCGKRNVLILKDL
jgi:hypothetical protein